MPPLLERQVRLHYSLRSDDFLNWLFPPREKVLGRALKLSSFKFKNPLMFFKFKRKTDNLMHTIVIIANNTVL